MKYTTILSTIFVCQTMAATTTRKPLFTVPFIGLTDLDMIDYTEGVASGVFKQDVRASWEGCIMGIPTIEQEVQGMVTDLIANFSNLGQLFTNLSKLQALFNLFIDLIKNGPADIKACSDIV